MKSSNTKRKIAETVVGAAIGAAIAGPAGALAGGLVGSQVASHTPPAAEGPQGTPGADDPMAHVALKRILVPLDFSPPSRQALHFARDWAARFGSDLCLLHVLEPVSAIAAFDSAAIVPPMPPVDLHEQARAELEKIVREELPEPLKASVQLRVGVPYDQIATAARELGVDLIIISTHGRTGLSHALLGSTAERVVRHAPCPVLTLRRAARG